MDNYTPLQSYSYSPNRLLVIDWSSLAYHQIFALVSKKRTSLELDSIEAELYAWRTGMVNKLLRYIYLFNPRDMVVTLEGTNVWRKEYCINYYNENSDIYYDTASYYLRYDNFLYRFFKKSNNEIDFEKLDVINDINRLPKKMKKLKDLPDKTREIFWNTILPKYKGNRDKQDYWPFNIDKNQWKKLKDEFAYDIAKVFRTHILKSDQAEGDDAVYVTVKYWADKYESIILVTGDGDFQQLLVQKNLKIYDHKKDDFVACSSPKDMLEIKVLSGDKSDNVHGIALPNKKTQLGPAGASKLYESVGNCFEQAKKEGWDNQYLRNKKLIDLNNIPTHVQRELCEILDKSNPQLGDIKDLYHLNVTEVLRNEITNLQNFGFYIFHSLSNIDKNPRLFNPKLFDKAPASIISSRKFEDIGSVFEDPINIL
jgi:5'-3' exonuclease